MAEPVAARRRRQRRRRRIVAGIAAGAVVAAGAGTAWAMSGDDAPSYRFATATQADVSQTVEADGTLAAADTATLSFAAGGTVASVGVAVGDTVTAGRTVARLDPADLTTAVTTAQAALATAKEALANDREAQANGTTVSADTGNAAGGAPTSSFVASDDSAVLAAAVTPTTSGGSSSIVSAQNTVIAAQRQLDTALSSQDTAVSQLVTACASGDDTTPATVTFTAGDDGTVHGTARSSPAVVTLRTSGGDLAETSSTNPQRVASDDDWSFAGLTAGDSYRVVIARTATVDTDTCLDAVRAVSAGQRALDKAQTSLRTALTALTKAIAAGTATGTTQGGSSAPSRSTAQGGSSGSASGGSASTPAGAQSTNGSQSTAGSTGVAVTAERIAADVKTVDAKQAAVAVAKQSLRHAALTSTIGGTVAAVDIATGDTVTAGAAAITVVGTGTLSATVDISITDIDLVKVGQQATVTVDGRTNPVPAEVTYIGATNTASGTTASYPVTVTLDKRYASLYDGMGADIAIDVGTSAGVLTVPLSAVHTTARGSTVQLRDGNTVTTTAVTTGLVGTDRVQIESGLRAGQQVALAETSAAVPTSTTSTRRGGTFGGGTFGGGTGGTFGGGPPGGR